MDAIIEIWLAHDVRIKRDENFSQWVMKRGATPTPSKELETPKKARRSDERSLKGAESRQHRAEHPGVGWTSEVEFNRLREGGKLRLRLFCWIMGKRCR
jgi:hypothetical protein